MIGKTKSETRRGIILTLVILGLITVLAILPYQFGTKAGSKGLVQKTVSEEDAYPNYDIREDKEAAESLVRYRQAAGKDASFAADARDAFVRGENALQKSVPTLKVEYNTDLRIPEVIGPDAMLRRAFLTAATTPAGSKHSGVLINFLKQNTSLIGASTEQIDGMNVFADYTNPDGNLSFVELEQNINGIPVFRGGVKAGFSRDGSLIRVINNFAPGLDYNSVPTSFGDPATAVTAAAGFIGHKLTQADQSANEKVSTDIKAVFGQGGEATTAEKMYFPTEPGVARAAWRVLIWQPVNAYYVIVDAETGTMLWRKNISNDQTAAATYNVYSTTTNLGQALDSPSPFNPGPLDPTTSPQAGAVSRTNVTLIGNEAAQGLSFNNNGWITDGTNGTDGNTSGNALIAGLDIDGVNGVDAPQNGTGRVFNFAYIPSFIAGGVPPPTGTEGGEALTLPAYRSGVVTNLFYLNNRYHDALYKVGFTELARNFQLSNFARGGNENDRVSAEAQDSSGTNNANFATPADGTFGRMQMFVFTNGTAPARDGSLDSNIVWHEHTHGLSNRLIGNGSGLTSTRSGGIGEGWSDLYPFLLGSKTTDPVNGVYVTGGYATYKCCGATTFTQNSYYGIRRLPYAPIGFTGGPSNRPFNPLTFSDLNTVTATDGAFPCSTLINCAGSATEVHNAGEIWAVTGIEVWARFVTRLGHDAGTLKTMQLYTDGMKLSPLNPNFIQSRDAIIAAAAASPFAPEAASDTADVREGFRLRGMGFGATDNGTTAGESFAQASIAPGSPTVTSGNNLLEPNECNTLNFPLSNNAAVDATGITAVLSSTTPGITVTQPNSAYPNIVAGGGPTNNTTPYRVSVANTVACFTQANFTLTVTYTGGGGGSPAIFTFALPVGLQGLDYAFTSGAATIPAGGVLAAGSQADDAAVPITLPAGWSSTVYGTAVTSLSANTNGSMTINAASPTTFTNTALPGTTFGATPTLFPYWDDLIMTTAATTNGGIYVNTIGVAPTRQFYVEWRARHFSETVVGISTNFAILLTEGSDVVRYIYTSTGIGAQLNGSSATVGVQAAATGTQFTQFSFNTASLSAGLQLTAQRPAGQCTAGTGTCATAAHVTVSGRVLNSEGRGVRYARVAITDNSGNARIINTGPYGYYHFDDVESGQSYVISVMSRRYSYLPRLLQVTDNISDVDFVPGQ